MPQQGFTGILALLERMGVRFVLIGGLAMIAHGSARITEDIDLAYSRDQDNVARLAAAMRSVRPILRGVKQPVPSVVDERTFRNTLNLSLDTDLGPVDLLGHVAGVSSFDTLWERAVLIDVFGSPVHVASIDDLIAMKKSAGRDKDKLHEVELRALQKLLEEEAKGER